MPGPGGRAIKPVAVRMTTAWITVVPIEPQRNISNLKPIKTLNRELFTQMCGSYKMIQ